MQAFKEDNTVSLCMCAQTKGLFLQNIFVYAPELKYRSGHNENMKN